MRNVVSNLLRCYDFTKRSDYYLESGFPTNETIPKDKTCAITWNLCCGQKCLTTGFI